MKKEIQIPLPVPVREILQKIQVAGYEAYAVGGCVRDSIMGRKPEDWDITTSALPQQIKELFPRTVDTGIQHGTVTVIMNRTGYEVTTYRIDGEYEDGRHPDHVTFTGNLLEDLKRRDFTINAMAYNEKVGLVDAFGGRKDLAEGRIRCVGSPRQRFEEDALRMMRAVRFSAQLDYEIEMDTLEAIREMAPRLSMVSAERIQTELVKLLTSDHPERIKTTYDIGLLDVFCPRLALDWKADPAKKEERLRGLQVVSGQKVLRLTMLLYDMEDPGRILKDLKFDNDTLKKVCTLILHRHLQPEERAVCVRRAMVKVGVSLFEALLEIQEAQLLATGYGPEEEKQQYLCRIREEYRQIIEAGDCLDIKNLAVTGADLIEAGMKPGKAMGETLKRLLWHVLEFPEDNEKDRLLTKVDWEKE